MRITYVTASTELWGGIAVVFQHLELLSEAGHDAFLTTPAAKPDWYHLKAPIYPIQNLDPAHIPHADIIVATSWTTIKPVVESKKGIPVHLCQGLEGDYKEWHSQKAVIDEVYSYKIPKLTVSPHLDEFLIERFDAKTYYIGQMVNRDIFYPSQGRHTEKRNSPFRILVVGPFEADFKNIPVALRGVVLAGKRLGVPLKLIRASQFPLSDEEQTIIKPDAYHFHVPYHEMGEIYRSADLFISMSKEAEGFGLPALEAMSCGVPTILSSISSYTSFDETRNYSLFVKHSDPESLADAIVEIFNNRTLREKLVHQGLIVAGKFTKENVLNRLNSSFESILYRDKLE
jgi:glycosyltransferase involved in cell wall biosynthesis